MPRIASALAAGTLLLLCICATGSVVMARDPSPGHAGPVGSRVDSPRRGVHSAKPIRTPRDCYRACKKLSGTNPEFCAASCYPGAGS
jgi:hypothetical protein